MLSSFVSRWLQSKSRKSANRRPHFTRLWLEVLEDRTLLATFTVNTSPTPLGRFAAAGRSHRPTTCPCGDIDQFQRAYRHDSTHQGAAEPDSNIDIQGPGAGRLTVQPQHRRRLRIFCGSHRQDRHPLRAHHLPMADLSRHQRRRHPQSRHADRQQLHPLRQLRQASAAASTTRGSWTSPTAPSPATGLPAAATAAASTTTARHADGQQQHPLGNFAASVGGGIYNICGTLTVSNSTFSGNSTASQPRRRHLQRSAR